MLQCKIFYNKTGGFADEKKMNDWLSEKGDSIEIISTTSTSTEVRGHPGIAIAIFYKTINK